VRKVLGANIPDIIFLLSKKVLLLVILRINPGCACLLLGYVSLMENFAYRMELNYFVYLLITLAAMGLVFLTILFQSLKTARSNPVDSLKYE